MEMQLKNLIGLCLFVVWGCAGLAAVARTANDIARDACVLFATENKAALGASVGSPADWCAVRENVAPFLDSILSAQRMSAQRMGIAPRNPE
jgi:hypothetical protein